jgi:cytochrome c oxidase assembly protein subunit 11
MVMISLRGMYGGGVRGMYGGGVREMYGGGLRGMYGGGVREMYGGGLRGMYGGGMYRLGGGLRATARCYSQNKRDLSDSLYYIGAVIVTFFGLSYAAVPLYKLICQQTGLDGTPMTTVKFDPQTMVPVNSFKTLKIHFDASVSNQMPWSFKPETKSLLLVPGETALAFFKAENPTDSDIVGISTYSVVPAKAAQYFNKIQCFCFEEQKLASKEQVDMPVFFYIDPEFTRDPLMQDVNDITLHYTFFKSKNQS